MPNVKDYGSGSFEKQVQVYWEDKINAGGSLFLPKYPASANYFVTLPFLDLYSTQKLSREKAASVGKHAQGGYYIIKDVQDSVGSTTYYDIWLFSHEIAEKEDTLLKKYSSFQDRYVKSSELRMVPKGFCCFNDDSRAEVSNFKLHVNGLARIISYEKNE